MSPQKLSYDPQYNTSIAVSVDNGVLKLTFEAENFFCCQNIYLVSQVLISNIFLLEIT